MVYVGAWGVPCFENVENELKLLFRMSMNVWYYGANVRVLLHVG
jgi:hypothetical protein